MWEEMERAPAVLVIVDDDDERFAKYK